MPEMHNVPLDSPDWGWAPGAVRNDEFHGRPCITFGETVYLIAPVAGYSLPLTEGDNDLAISVSEDFGGWGIQARFDSLDGLQLDIPVNQ